MALRKGTRIGGRGCPSCGSHNTEGFAKNGAQGCLDCNHKWLPCTPGCRGYRLDLDSPAVKGCVECGVPDSIVVWWPEAYRALANRLTQAKNEELGQE